MVSRQYVFKQVSAEDGDRISLPFYAGKIRILPSNDPETKDTIAWIEPAPGLRNFAADYLNQTAFIIGLMLLVFLLSLAFIAAVHYYTGVI